MALLLTGRGEAGRNAPEVAERGIWETWIFVLRPAVATAQGRRALQHYSSIDPSILP